MKRFIALFVLTIPSICNATAVVYKVSTNDILAMGALDLSQFSGQADVGTIDMDDSKIAKTSNGILTLKMLVFNPITQSVDLRTQVQQDAITNLYNLQADILQIIQLRAYLTAGTQLGNLVASQAIKDQIAIATNTIQSQITVIVAKH